MKIFCVKENIFNCLSVLWKIHCKNPPQPPIHHPQSATFNARFARSDLWNTRITLSTVPPKPKNKYYFTIKNTKKIQRGQWDGWGGNGMSGRRVVDRWHAVQDSALVGQRERERKREEEERRQDEEDRDGGRSLHSERSLHGGQILLVHSLSFFGLLSCEGGWKWV